LLIYSMFVLSLLDSQFLIKMEMDKETYKTNSLQFFYNNVLIGEFSLKICSTRSLHRNDSFCIRLTAKTVIMASVRLSSISTTKFSDFRTNSSSLSDISLSSLWTVVTWNAIVDNNCASTSSSRTFSDRN